MRLFQKIFVSSFVAIALAPAIVAAAFGLSVPAAHAEGATLKVTPNTGSYEVGGLIDVSFVVDTGGQTINAVQADVLFPPDKLQVVNPVASTSFISLWVTAPTYSNTDGTVKFQGGIPNPGIKTSGGVISTVTFRVKASGKATIRYAPTSRVLLNDGSGTNILTSSGTAEFTLKVPPPAGPVVSSPTHPDSNTWFNNPQVQYQWEAVDGAQGYSYAFDQNGKTVPEEKNMTTATSTSVKASSDGIWYFHIRALTTSWGGVTTIPVQIDASAPASFQPTFDHKTITVEEVPTLRFVTSDSASGIDHYEVKIVSLNTTSTQSGLFVETISPFTASRLTEGNYEFIVRAFDHAGNSSDSNAKLTVTAAGLPFYARVPLLRNPVIANSVLIGLGVIALILVLILAIRHFRLRTSFQHDLASLEKDALRKSKALEQELSALRYTQHTPPQQGGMAPPTATPSKHITLPKL